MRVGGSVRRVSRKVTLGGAVVLAIGMVIISVSLAAGSATPSPEEIQAEIDALNAQYAALPPLEDPEALLERNQAYEKAFAQIGFEAPNGQSVDLSSSDYVPNFPPPGIQDAPEAPPGYVPVNQWIGEVNGAPLMVTSVVAEADSSQGGVIVDTVSGPLSFIPSPKAVGALTIESADGFTLHLVSKDGEVFAFDVTQLLFS